MSAPPSFRAAAIRPYAPLMLGICVTITVFDPVAGRSAATARRSQLDQPATAERLML